MRYEGRRALRIAPWGLWCFARCWIRGVRVLNVFSLVALRHLHRGVHAVYEMRMTIGVLLFRCRLLLG